VDNGRREAGRGKRGVFFIGILLGRIRSGHLTEGVPLFCPERGGALSVELGQHRP